MAPWPLMDQVNEPGGKQRLLVYLFVHRYGSGSVDGCWVSTARLAAETGMKRDDVCAALTWLVREGWAERESRPGKSSVYFLRADAPIPQKGDAPQKGPIPQKVDDTHPPKGGTTHPPKGDTNKNPVTRTQELEKKQPVEPPLPPASGGAPAGPPLVNSPPDPNPSTASGPPDPSPGSAAPLPRAPRFRPTVEDIPVQLLPVDREILEFWPTKAGQKNLRAWEFLLAELGRIQQHPQGGTEVVRAQLVLAVKRAMAGKAWISVTFDNWWKLGREQQQRRVSQTSQAFADVGAFLDAMEAAKR